MKTLYICQSSCGFLMYTYAEGKEEAKEYFEELIYQFTPAWFGGSYSMWPCPEGWFLSGTEENYTTLEGHDMSMLDDKISMIPFPLGQVKEQLRGYRERREEKNRKNREKEEQLKREREKRSASLQQDK